MTNASVTLRSTGIDSAIDDGERYDSARARMVKLDRGTQLREMKVIGGQPDFALGSVHAITRDGTLVIASTLGSQLASYAWCAAQVIFVVGAQNLVPDLDAARERIYGHRIEREGRAGPRLAAGAPELARRIRRRPRAPTSTSAAGLGQMTVPRRQGGCAT